MLYIPSDELEQAKALRTMSEGMPGAGRLLDHDAQTDYVIAWMHYRYSTTTRADFYLGEWE